MNHSAVNVPNPSNEQHNRALCQLLQNAMQQVDGSISFAHFMEHVLHHPQFGYYNRPEFCLGPAGDFTTAPEISPIFAHCIANFYLELRRCIANTSILELGAGSGRFASDLLLRLHQLDQLPKNYFIFEINPVLRAKQQALLRQTCPFFIDHIHWLEYLLQDFTGLVFCE